MKRPHRVRSRMVFVFIPCHVCAMALGELGHSSTALHGHPSALARPRVLSPPCTDPWAWGSRLLALKSRHRILVTPKMPWLTKPCVPEEHLIQHKHSRNKRCGELCPTTVRVL